MSYILDALKKSERDRHRGQVPRIGTVHDDVVTPLPRRWPWRSLLVSGGLLVNGLVLAWVLLFQGWADEPPTTRAVTPMPPSAVEATAPAPPRRIIPPVAVRPPDPVALDLRRASPVTTAMAPALPLASPLPDKPASPIAADEVPSIEQLSPNLRQALPSLDINVHVFDTDPNKRFMLINMHKYQEGQQIQNGPYLETITPDGAVLRLDGQYFRISRQ